MPVATIKRAKPRLHLGPDDNGLSLTPEEFDHADYEEGWVYELVNGVLIVSPTPTRKERDPNQELGHWLLTYQESHPQGSALDDTLPEEMIKSTRSRRRGDRAIWAGLGRLPTDDDPPTIAVEFVSKGKRNRQRDYEEKRHEYEQVGVEEYWIIDRFRRTMTVYIFRGGKVRKRIIRENQTYTTPLLPGFELPLARLFQRADRWPE